MKKIIIPLLILGLFTVQIESKIKHECQHNDLNHDIIHEESDDHSGHRRALFSSSWSPMRVTYDLSSLNSLPADKKGFIELLGRQMDVGAQFFQDNLNLKISSGNNKFPSHYTKCYNKVVSSQDKSTGIPNSDLHIYVTFTNEPTKSYVAYATPCVMRSGDRRPVFGLVNFNIGYLKVKDFERSDYFEYVNEITLHEMTHVLGFSQYSMNMWVDPKTGSQYSSKPYQTITSSKGVSETWVVTDKVKAFARNHYKCSTMPGQKLENQGGSGSAGSHWEKVMIENEFMTASVIKHDAVYSGFTFSLLEDSGWYKPNYQNVDPVEWGKDNGCKFLDNCAHYSWEEFDKQQVNVCNFHHNSVAKVTSYHTFGDQCMIARPISDRLCIDPSINNWIPERQSGEVYGDKSACFDSNIQSRTPSPQPRSTVDWYLKENRCLEHTCDSNGNISIYIMGEKYQIDKATNKVDIKVKGKNTDIEGYVNGPSDPDAFCNTYPKPCPNYCSRNGYCMGKICHCIEGYYGADCSQEGSGTTCPTGTFLYQGSCISSCPNGTYKANDTCLSCPAVCATCLSTAKCYSCNYGYYLHKLQCISKCPLGYYGDKSTNVAVCKPCGDNCDECSNSSSCDKCDTGYVKQYNSPDCVRQCPASCTQCSSPTVCTVCDPYKVKMAYSSTNVQCLNACPSGYYKNSVSECKRCRTGCQKCSSYYTCLDPEECTEGQVEHNGKCYSQCPSGYYENSSNKCSLCDSSCRTCKNSTSCDSCDTGYSVSSSTGLCVKNTSSTGCDEGCDYCYKNKCYRCKSGYLKTYIGSVLTCQTECPFGYYQSSSSCYTCDANCSGCVGSRNICLDCASDDLKKYYSNSGKLMCVESCPVRSQLGSNGECVKCGQDQYYYMGQCLNECPSGTSSNLRICEKPCNVPCDYSTRCGEGYYLYKYGGLDICVTECPGNRQPYDGKC